MSIQTSHKWSSASEMTYIVSSGALNSTHSLTHKWSTLINVVVLELCDSFKFHQGLQYIHTAHRNAQTGFAENTPIIRA